MNSSEDTAHPAESVNAELDLEDSSDWFLCKKMFSQVQESEVGLSENVVRSRTSPQFLKAIAGSKSLSVLSILWGRGEEEASDYFD